MGAAFLIGRSYYFCGVRFMVGMSVVGAVTVAVALAEKWPPVVLIQ